jgi:hypothetical protein
LVKTEVFGVTLTGASSSSRKEVRLISDIVGWLPYQTM